MPLISASIRTISASLIIAALIVSTLVYGKDILLPMTVAVLMAFILLPIVKGLIAVKVPKGIAVVFVMFSLAALLTAFGTVVSRQIISLTADMSSYRYNFVEKVRTVTGSSDNEYDRSELSKAADAIESIGSAIRDEISGGDRSDVPRGNARPSEQQTVVVENPAEDDSSAAWDYLISAIEPLAQIALAFLLTAFLLAQYQDLRDRVVRVIGTDHMTDTISAMSEAGERLSRLFLMQAILNIGFGATVGLALWFIGVPNAPLWGVVTAAMRFVPYVGSLLAALPPLVLAAAVDPGWGMFLATFALFVVGEPLMGHVIEPLALGKRAGISPFAMVISAAFWTLVWGPIGLILAAPLTMTLIVLGKYITGLEFFSILLGDQPPLSPPHEFYHRLLSDDPVSAAHQLDAALTRQSLGEIADELVFPALSIASNDHRRGRLDKEQIEDLVATSAEVWDLVTDDAQRDVGGDQGNGKRFLVVPARGAIDGMAARFVSRIIRSENANHGVVVSSLSGLTGLSDFSASSDPEPPDELIVVSVSGMQKSHLKFIVGRAVRDFPGTTISIVEFPGRLDLLPLMKGEWGEQVTVLRSPANLGPRLAIVGNGRKAANLDAADAVFDAAGAA